MFIEVLIIESTVVNPQGPLFTGGQTASVSWSLVGPDGEEVSSSTGTLPDGGSPETWDYTSNDVTEGDWSLTIEVTSGDNVNVENDVTILYPEGSEDSPNPRPE